MAEDTFKQQGMRRELVHALIKKNMFSTEVITAISGLPRHWFMFDNAFDFRAYEDNAFPIGEGQTISQPSTVAYQTDLLNVKKMDKILEIGTGSGYQAAVLSMLGARVYTIERQKKLHERVIDIYKEALKKVPELQYVKLHYGDGFLGLPSFAPYDKILVTCGAPEIPNKLVQQLKTGGYMVIPVSEGEGQRMWRITKAKDGTVIKEEFDMFKFVPMLKGTHV